MKRQGVIAALALLGCAGEETTPAPCYMKEPRAVDICEALPEACTAPAGAAPSMSDAVTIVPSDAMPDGVVSQTSHNNLDVVWHGGRLFFAFRTAPSHFASSEVVLYVVSTTDLQSWTLEARFALQKDLREPRFLTLGDRLLLYFARLGEVTFTFDPEAMMLSEQQDGCVWSAPEEIAPTGEPGFIPWRAREIDGRGYLMGYVGGENIYEIGGEGTAVHWLQTSDGRSFEPVIANQSAVLTGGTSETDWAFLDDGGLVAVSRNEAGDAEGWGSKICRAAPASLGNWECVADPKKYDSPLVFRDGADVYLIGRRQLANDGNYDLGMRELSPEDQALTYQAEYWGTSKRCALWKIDPTALRVDWVLDLPSNGDTCFASNVPLSPKRQLVFNYTSPLADPDLAWNEGQFGPTYIYRLTLGLP